MRKTTTALALTAALALATTACSDDSSDTSTDGGGSDGTAAEASTGTTMAAGADGEGAMGECPEETVLEVTTTEGDAVELAAEVSVADVIDLSPPWTATFSFASYEVGTEELRGVYQPTLEGDELFVAFSVQAEAELEPGEYIEQTSDEAGADIINFTDIVTADGRQLPTVDHVITITEVTDEQVCGEIAPLEADGIGAAVVGSFTGERIDE